MASGVSVVASAVPSIKEIVSEDSVLFVVPDNPQALANGITPDDIQESSKVGIRPQLVDWKKKDLVMDFVVIKKDGHVHILNAVSPAFTCCMPFAEFIVDKYLS